MTGARVVRERGAPVEKISIRSVAVKPVKFFFTSDWWWRVQPTIGGTIPEMVALGSVRKYAERVSRWLPSMASVSDPVSRFLPCFGLSPDFFQ